MPKLITGSLMLALSAFSFFCSAEFNPTPEEWVAPKQSSNYVVTSFWPAGYDSYMGSPLSNPDAVSMCQAAYPENDIMRNVSGYLNVESETSVKVQCTFDNWNSNGGWHYVSTTDTTLVTFGLSPENIKTCPPDEFPDYKKEVDSDGDGEIDKCLPKFPLCPLGYARYSIDPYGCIPVECPSRGQVDNAIPTFGKIPVGVTGTYCDGFCSYSITSGVDYGGAQWVSGVSNGAICGQAKTKSYASFTPEDQEENCTNHELSNGSIYQECVNVTEPGEGDGDNNGDGSGEGVDNTENKMDENSNDSPYQGVDCTTVEDKTTCIGKNIVEAISDQSNKLKEDAAERHNKLLEQQKSITDYVEKRRADREKARQDDARQVVNGLDAVRQAIVDGGNGAGGGGSSNEGVISAIDGLSDSVSQTDVETDSTPSSGIESFYEPEYPNGFSDVYEKNKAAFDASAPVAYLNSWKSTLSGTPPDLEMCFDLGSLANFGCKSFVIDPRVFPFLRIIILVSTLFLCRALVMGG